MTITQRSLAYVLLGIQSIGMALVAIGLISEGASATLVTVVSCVALLYAIFLFAYWRGWEGARYATIGLATLSTILFLPEPFLTHEVSFMLFISPLQALILTSPTWVVGSAVVGYIGLFIRAGGQGVYANPVTAVIYGIIIGGMVISRLVTDRAMRAEQVNAREAEEARIRAEAETERATAAQSKAEQHAQELIQRTREAHANEARFRTLADATAAGIFIYQHEQFQYVNIAAENLTGYTTEELYTSAAQHLFGRNGESLLHTWQAEASVAGAGSAPQELQLITKQGVERWIETTTATIDVANKPALLITAFDVTARKQAEAAIRQSIIQEETIRAQDATLRELSTPLIPLTDDMVVMPLIGAVDSRRAQQVMEAMLNGIATHSASVAILDITGVPVIDTQVAQALIRTAQAVNLLGAQVILTGIGPEIAQTLVGLGIDLATITTYSSLQVAITDALHVRA